MKNGLQEIPLPRVLAVKQLKKPDDKGLVDVALGQRRLELGGLKKTKEKSKDNL
jgi:hypothetical protein